MVVLFDPTVGNPYDYWNAPNVGVIHNPPINTEDIFIFVFIDNYGVLAE
jgi:hypothetical protein